MATEVTTAEGAAARSVNPSALPYAPSWADWLMDLMRRAPGPTWVAYVVVQLVALLVAAFEGLISTAGIVDATQLFYGLFFVAPLAVLHYLDHVAGQAWDAFRPVTNLDDPSAARARYTLTVMPARTGWVLLLLGYVLNTTWYVVDPAGIGIAGQPAPFVVVRAIVEGFLAATLFVVLTQVIRQLRIIGRLHDAATHIDLLRPQAVQAMSRLTARSAIVIVVLAVAIGVPVPGTSDQTLLITWLLFSAPMLGLALIAFVVPLRGLHDRLVEEKGRLLAASAARLHQTIDSIHALVDAEARNVTDAEQSRTAQTRIDGLSKAQTALVQERDLIGHISTWPWDPSTLRAVVSAIALPIVLFLITRVLDRFV